MNTHPLPVSTDNLFTSNATWQSWLDVEGALAIAQAELGMIPQSACDEIIKHTDLAQFDVKALQNDITASMSPIMSTVRALAAKCAGDAGGYVHWGATTQNIIIAGKTLQLRKSHRFMLARMANALAKMADMADQTADWLTVARTNRRQALPITFGYKMAGWIDEFQRCADRLIGTEPRTFMLIFGGAAGAMHSYGDIGQKLADTMAKHLGLTVSTVHSRATNDGFAEYVAMLGMFAVACERMGTELYTLMSNEVDEISEIQATDVVGSSTMPHKFNPKYVVSLLTTAARLRNLVGPTMEACRPSHEGDAAYNFRLYELIDEAGTLSYKVATQLETLLDHLKINQDRMYENLMRDPAPLVSEKIMMQLANTIGRQTAHDLVHHAIVDCRDTGISFADALYKHDDVRICYASRDALDTALDPRHYTGRSADIARDTAASARTHVTHIRQHIAPALLVQNPNGPA
jgi:3-carboxy-cis,cis-muconate cycloisomerase